MLLINNENKNHNVCNQKRKKGEEDLVNPFQFYALASSCFGF